MLALRADNWLGGRDDNGAISAVVWEAVWEAQRLFHVEQPSEVILLPLASSAVVYGPSTVNSLRPCMSAIYSNSKHGYGYRFEYFWPPWRIARSPPHRGNHPVVTPRISLWTQFSVHCTNGSTVQSCISYITPRCPEFILRFGDSQPVLGAFMDGCSRMCWQFIRGKGWNGTYWKMTDRRQ